MCAANAIFFAPTLVRTLPAMATPCDATAIFFARIAALTLAPMTTGATANLVPMASALAPRASLPAIIPLPMSAPLIPPVMAPA